MRFGFKAFVDFGVTNTAGSPDQYVLACELVANALKEAKRVITW